MFLWEARLNNWQVSRQISCLCVDQFETSTPPPPLPSGYLKTWKLVPSNSCPRNLLLSHSLAKMKSLTPFKIKHVYSNGKTWRFLFTPPQPRKVQIYHSPGTNDSKIPMGCPGKGECWGFELINALFLCLAFAPLHALPFWKRLCQG